VGGLDWFDIFRRGVGFLVSFDVSVRVLCGLCCGFGEWLEVVVDLFSEFNFGFC